MKGDSGHKGEKARHYYDANLKRRYCVFLISAYAPYLKRRQRANIWAYCLLSHPPPSPSSPPSPSLLPRRAQERLCSVRSFHFDSVPPMNMYKPSNIIFLMVIGLLPAWSQKQMVMTLPSSRCWERPPLLNMTTAINALIINGQAWESTEVSWTVIGDKPLLSFSFPLCQIILFFFPQMMNNDKIKFKQTFCCCCFRRNTDSTCL